MTSSGEAATTSEKRVRGRPFRKGTSGNPSGKRKNPLTPEEELVRSIKRVQREALKDVREAFLELSGLARDTATARFDPKATFKISCMNGR
jgi:hypothetical protein